MSDHEPVAVVRLIDDASPHQFAGLTRREITCIHARYALWRTELAERVQRRIAHDPRSPVGSDQRLIAFCDARLAEIRRVLGSEVAA